MSGFLLVQVFFYIFLIKCVPAIAYINLRLSCCVVVMFLQLIVQFDLKPFCLHY